MTTAMQPDDIIAESFRIIESEVGPHPFSPLEWPVVRRMLHASGDLELIHSMVFTADAVQCGITALRGGTPIVTDVRMVASGINRSLLEVLGGSIHCFIDDDEVAESAAERRVTRSYCAMEKAITLVPSAVFVIGNAPTALLALCEAVREKRIAPPLILALPVGFVSVAESKEQALALGVPVITVRGRKGGSAMAAAAVNALLILASEGAAP